MGAGATTSVPCYSRLLIAITVTTAQVSYVDPADRVAVQGRETLIATEREGMAIWRVVEVGVQVEL